MSKNFGKCFGPSTGDPSFRLRFPSCLLSKFALKSNVIQSVVRVGILGICITSSVLRVLLSRFWVSGSQVPSPKDPVPGSWVSGSQFKGPVCQGPVSQDPRVPVSQVSGSQGPEPRVLGSQIPGLRP